MQNHMQTAPRVSIGVPTYKRPDMLRRALQSIARQDFKDVEVIIGDNDCDSDAGERVAQEFRSRIPGLVYCRHAVNIGSTANFMHCLAAARGEYFMWLADDDELYGDSYIQSLVDVLDQNLDAVTAVAQWKRMHTPEHGEIQYGRSYMSKIWLLRVLKFVWKSDDDFFYGLHRTQLLRQAKMKNYWSINAKTASDLTFVYIIDLVIQGRIIRLNKKDVQWINHAYTDKDHTPKRSGRSVDMKFVLKRLNVHWLYAVTVYRRGGLLATLPLFTVSVASLGFEALIIIFNFIRARTKPIKQLVN